MKERAINMLLGRRWLAVALAIAMAAVISAAVVGRERGDSRVVLHEPIPATLKNSTLLEAWDVAEQTFVLWGGEWAVSSIYSTDINDAPDVRSGWDGRRRTWQVEAVSGEGQLRWLRITNGAAVEAIAPGHDAAAALASPQSRPSFDSPTAVEAAKQARPNLSGADGKSQGLHIGYGHDVKTGRILYWVSGAAGGQEARVVIDGDSGEIVRAERLVLTGGGLLASRDAGQSWEASPLAGVVSAVASDAESAGDTLAAFAAVWSGEALELWRTGDSGRSWARVAALPPETGDAAYDLEVVPFAGQTSVLIPTYRGLWAFGLADRQLTLVPTPGLVLDIAVDGAGMLHAAIMSPRVPDSARQYVWSTVTGGEWREVSPAPVTRLVETQHVVGYSQNDPTYAEIYDLEFDSSGNRGLRVTRFGIERSVDAGATWTLVKEVDAFSVVMAPDFERSGTALATAFPDLMLRTSDGGETWLVIYVFEGRRSGRAFFAASSLAFIAMEGTATWQEM